MNQTNKLEFLKKQIGDKKDYFEKHSSRHKHMHRRFRLTSFALTALLAILAGMALYMAEFTEHLNIGILIVSAIAGAVASYEGLRKPEELWTHERSVYLSLVDLERELEFRATGRELSDSELDGIFEKFQCLLSESHVVWHSQIIDNGNGNNSNET